MVKIEQNQDNDLNYQCDNSNHQFLYIDNISSIKNIDNGIQLCIIRTDFKKSEIKLIKTLKESNKATEFWLTSNNQTRENVLIANKLGIKTIISSPVDKKAVEDFFNKKSNNLVRKKGKVYNDESVANSKIMIVDDNPMNVALLEEILANTGLNITTFLKPKDALKVANKEKFDLFLLDIMMPEMSGFELANKIKNSPVNKEVPFIFISALSDAHNKIKSYDIGSLAYIEKPFDVNVVKSQIFNLMKNRKAQEEIVSAQEGFLATVAHDLKTPINAEIHALNMLLNKNFGDFDDAQKEILEDLLGSTKFMKNVVENLLCKNKIDNDKVELQKQVYSIEDLVKNCIEMTKYTLDTKLQKVILKSNHKHLLIPLDFIEIQRVVNNLITNSSEYSPNGSNIIIEIFDSHKRLGVSIQDFGAGIPEDQQKNVFYEYISHAKKFKKIGAGLGLFIAKKIIEQHNGEIFLESKLGEGTKITFFLPIYEKE